MVLTSPNSHQEVWRRVRQTAQFSCERGLHKLSFGALGTECRVLFHSVPASQAKEFQLAVLSWVTAFEARYSRFLPDSLVGRINAAAGLHPIEVDAEADRIFALCDSAVFFTEGAFDPTALPIIRLWNWKTPALPDHATVEEAKQLVGWRKVQRKPGSIFLPEKGMCLDLGGIGKEFAVDSVFNMAHEAGIKNVLVDFGNDIRASGHPIDKAYWAIGLEDARSPGKCWVGLAITGAAVATSGDYIRSFELNGRRYSHLLDPRTGYPADKGCRAVSVIASSCTLAGMLSTSAFVVGPLEGTRLIEKHLGPQGAVTTDTDRLYTRNFYEHVIPA